MNICDADKVSLSPGKRAGVTGKETIHFTRLQKCSRLGSFRILILIRISNLAIRSDAV